MPNTPEIKSADDFQAALETKGLAASEKLAQLKETAQEHKLEIVNNFMTDFLVEKASNGYLILKSKVDNSEFRIPSLKQLNEMFKDALNGGNELQVNDLRQEIEIKQVTKSTREEVNELHTEVEDGVATSEAGAEATMEISRTDRMKDKVKTKTTIDPETGVVEINTKTKHKETSKTTVNAAASSNAENNNEITANSLEKRNVKGVTAEYDPANAMYTFNFNDWLLLKKSDAGTSAIRDVNPIIESNQVRRFERRHNRHMLLTNENKKARKLEKDERKAAKINESISRQRDALANTTVDVMGAAEKRKQLGYYDLVINHAIAEFRTNTYHKDNVVYIDSYIPLFVVDGNPTGRVGIRMNPTDVAAYGAEMSNYSVELGRAYTPEELAWRAAYPEDARSIQTGGAIGAIGNVLVERTNMTPNQAENFKSAAKLGTLVGLGVLSWMTIKRVFNIGGKYSTNERVGWGVGAAAVLIGIPALTGKNVWDLLTKGDSKDTWNKMKGLLDKNGIHFENPFESTDNKIVFPALGNRLFGDMSIADLRQYTVTENGVVRFKENEFQKYLENQIAGETEGSARQTELKNKYALLKTCIRQKQTQKMFSSYNAVVHIDTAVNTSEKAEVAYKAYIDGQLMAGSLLEGDKKHKISDQTKFEQYIYTEVVTKGRATSSITKEELKNAGLLTEVTEEEAKANAEAGGKSTYEQVKEDVKETAADVSKRTKETWENTKKSVAAAAATVKGRLGFEKKPEDPELTKQKADLAKREAELEALENMEDVKRDQVATLEDIHELQEKVKDVRYKVEQLEAMRIATDPELLPLVKNKTLTAEMAIQLTSAKNALVLEYDQINRDKENSMMRFSVQNGQLYLASYNEQIPIRLRLNPDKKTYIGMLSDCPIQFNDAKNLLQAANFYNFVVRNYAYTSKKEKPFYNDGNEISMSADGIDKDMLEALYNDIDKPRTKKFVDWMNSRKGELGTSLWLDTGKPTGDIIELKNELESTVIAVGGVGNPELPEQFSGKKDAITDAKALRRDAQGKLIGYGKAEVAFDGHGLVYKTHDRETAISKEGNEWKVGDFKYAFETSQEALQVANFVNFCKKHYQYATTGTEPFNVSFNDGDLEFARNSDNHFLRGLSDVHTDFKVLNKNEMMKLSSIFTSKDVRKAFADFLNKTYDKWKA